MRIAEYKQIDTEIVKKIIHHEEEPIEMGNDTVGVIPAWDEEVTEEKPIMGMVYRDATPEEEAVGIDGYVGDIPYSVKPDTYKTMGRLSETIDVKMIYYTKTKTGLKIEVED